MENENMNTPVVEENVDLPVVEEEVESASVPAEEKQYSSFRYAVGAVLAFFGIASKTHRASKKRGKLIGDIFTYVILLFGAFIMVYPFWWMVAGSFAFTGGQDGAGTTAINTFVWWPSVTTWNTAGIKGFFNYTETFTRGLNGSVQVGVFSPKLTYWRALLNNLIYSIVPVVVGVITSASAAFSFAKINWIGRNKVFFFLLAAIMVPGPALMTTQYAMYSDIGMLNGFALVVPGLFGSIMTAFFIRQFLFGLPTSIIEAAKIDGAGYLRIFVQFILPLAMPAIMAQGLLSFMGCWNNYMGSYIFINKQSEWINLPHAMYIMESIYSNKIGSGLGPVIAASVVCVLPVIILFACFQKLIIGSLMLTGSKE